MPFDPDRLAPFVRDMTKLPLLSRKEQIDLIRKAQKGDRDAREKLIKHNIRFVMKIARKWSKTRTTTDDITAEAMDGLNRAIDKFDARKKCSFLTYAKHWVEARITRRVLEDHCLVKIGTNNFERSMFFRKHLLDPRSSGPNGELARRMMPNSEITRAVRDMEPEPDQKYDIEERKHRAREKVHAALSQLDERSRAIMQARFLVDHEDKETFEELGKKFGVSRERIRQIEMKAMKKISGILKKEKNREEKADGRAGL